METATKVDLLVRSFGHTTKVYIRPDPSTQNLQRRCIPLLLPAVFPKLFKTRSMPNQ